MYILVCIFNYQVRLIALRALSTFFSFCFFFVSRIPHNSEIRTAQTLLYPLTLTQCPYRINTDIIYTLIIGFYMAIATLCITVPWSSYGDHRAICRVLRFIYTILGDGHRERERLKPYTHIFTMMEIQIIYINVQIGCCCYTLFFAFM